jgi:hypothetical protein
MLFSTSLGVINQVFRSGEFPKSQHKNFLNRDDKKTFNEWNNIIDSIAESLFIQAQSYVMISLRKNRGSNSIKKRDIKAVRVPETHAQDIISISVIKKYIINYLENGEIYDALL